MLILSVVAFAVGLIIGIGGYIWANRIDTFAAIPLFVFIALPGVIGMGIGIISLILATMGLSGGWISVPIISLAISCGPPLYLRVMTLFD